LLAFGTLDASAVECMQEDTQRVIARYRSQHPEEAETAETATTAADSRRVAKPRKDPQAREAAELRRQSRFLENWSRRTKYWDAGPGRCALCSWEGGGRVQCGICCRCVCGWCHVPEHAICQQCRVKSLRAQIPATVPRHQPFKCHWCVSTNLRGECYRCNRWLCNGCSVEQRVPACINCPAVHVPRNGMPGISLRINPVRHAGSSFDKIVSRDPRAAAQAADQATHACGRGRMRVEEGWAPSSRSGKGQVARAGQEWKRRRQEDGDPFQ